MTRWIVDGMNVIGSRPTGWWRDRQGAARRLVARLEQLVEATGDEVTVVLDGRSGPGGPSAEGAVRVLYARRRGPNAADERIAELVGEDTEPASLLVVTSDAALRREVATLGAEVVGATELLRHLDEVTGPQRWAAIE